MDVTKRDTIPSIQPALNHTTIGQLADNIPDYEFVVHPGDFAYADDWFEVSFDFVLSVPVMFLT